eukprot:TRINITY_DN15420_c0_g1_i1.p1 TRINITY_DN15420_c0_g1~~TRINITY_DN15420_c0_g1_i1.p1  ORF type:complete len:536 (+),score=151.55 TRINITY_DN15420_c0_g1_i1:1131-2738(+)
MLGFAVHELHSKFDQEWEVAAYLSAIAVAISGGHFKMVPVRILAAICREENLEPDLIQAGLVQLSSPPRGDSHDEQLLQEVVALCQSRGMTQAHAHVCTSWLGDWLAPTRLLMSGGHNGSELVAYMVHVLDCARKEAVASVFEVVLSSSEVLQGLLSQSPQPVCEILAAYFSERFLTPERVADHVAHLVALSSVSTAAMAEVNALIAMVSSKAPSILSSSTMTRAVLGLAKLPPGSGAERARGLLAQMMQAVPSEQLDAEAVLSALVEAEAHDALQPVWVRGGEPGNVLRSMLLGGEPSRALAYIELLCSSADCPRHLKQAVLDAILDEVAQLVSMSPRTMARLVYELFPEDNLKVLNMLAEAPEAQFLYVAAMTQYQSESGRLGTIRRETVTRALELAPQYAPEMMLKILEEFPDDYDLRTALSLAQLHQVPSAEAYLLERCGDDRGSLRLLLHAMDLRLADPEITGDLTDLALDSGEIAVAEVEAVLQVCNRADTAVPVSYTHLRAHETPEHLVCRLLLEKKKKNTQHIVIET